MGKDLLRSERGVALAAGLLALTASLVFAAGSDEFSLDDAYIHLAYAKSLRLGDGLSYNPGDWELGSTSPLWAILLAPLAGIEHTVMLVKGLGCLLHALGAVLTGLLAAHLVSTSQADVPASTARARALGIGIAGGLVALHPLLLQGASSGMEVPLTLALLAGVTLSCVKGRYGAAALLTAFAVWARPEACAYVGLLSVALAWTRRRRAALAPVLGAVVAMALWSLGCLLRWGYALPNTFYVKLGHLSPLVNLRYLVVRVASYEAWLMGVGGVVLIALYLRDERRRGETLGLLLFGSFCATLLAIALSRQLHPDVLFYMQRYFVIVAFVPAALVGAAVMQRGVRAGLWLLPSLVFWAVALPAAQARTRAQEHNIRVLHTEVAQWASHELPPDSRLLVEGAGALRYFTPRSMHISDMIGLNTGAIAHAPSPAFRDCLWAAEQPQYLAVPTDLFKHTATIFDGEILLRQREMHYAQTIHDYSRSVYVIRVSELLPELHARCRALANGAGS